ncbi:hypothetical protein [uncultured Clostridium sp.]|uniref:hypothetical protein n=1 Tax=uncultured Clostridium sp. TaxID=59620 RepID=UPI0025991F2D|nr:hypothetical protein [uncultured Clostridium sp.]
MSSDIKEISKLKELLCRKKVSKIKSKYYKAEKKIYKKYIRNKEEDSEFLLKSSFIEFRKRYFNNLYTTINNIVDNSIGNLESDMLEYISERDRYRTFEVISLIKSIFDRNHIIWALYDEYIECRKDGKCPETIIIVVGQEYRNIALNIFNVLGERVNNVVFLINNIKVQLAFTFEIENNTYYLTNNNIKYCILEDERIPILTP